MKKKFPIAELVAVSRRLPEMNYSAREFTPGMPRTPADLDGVSELYLRAYGGVLKEHMNLDGVPKSFHEAYRVAAAHAVHQTLTRTRASEATQSGVLPTFTTAKLMTIMQAYPQIRALQLFGFLPMSQPTGSLFFDKYTYATPHTSSTPNIAAGDETSDIAKFNKNFTKVPEGRNVPKITMEKKRLDVSTEDHRIAATWSDRYLEDADRVYGENGAFSHMSHAGYMMGWTWDRTMVDACIAKVPTANKATFDATPAASPDYAALSPSEQEAYDQRLYTYGFTSVFHKIRTTNQFGMNSDPTWALVGPGIALLCDRIKGFVPTAKGPADYDFSTGPIRDLGYFASSGLRVMVDPMLDLDLTGQSRALFGRRPMQRDEPGHYLGVYVPMRVTRDWYDPNVGETTQAIWSSIAAITSDSGEQADSVELDRKYGELLVTL